MTFHCLLKIVTFFCKKKYKRSFVETEYFTTPLKLTFLCYNHSCKKHNCIDTKEKIKYIILIKI